MLRASGVDFEAVDHTAAPLGRARIEELLRKLGMRPRDLLRKRAPGYRARGLDRPDVSDDEVLDALAEDPELIQRPIVERGDRAIVARPPERVREVL